MLVHIRIHSSYPPAADILFSFVVLTVTAVNGGSITRGIVINIRINIVFAKKAARFFT